MKELKKEPLPIRVFKSLKDKLDKARKKEGIGRSRTNAMEKGIRMYIDDIASRSKKGTK